MTNEDEFKILVGGYYGVQEMDTYDLKVYVMKTIEEYIQKFISENPIFDFDYQVVAEQLKSLPLKRKLQDSLLVLRKIDVPLELELMVKEKLRELKNECE